MLETVRAYLHHQQKVTCRHWSLSVVCRPTTTTYLLSLMMLIYPRIITARTMTSHRVGSMTLTDYRLIIGTKETKGRQFMMTSHKIRWSTSQDNTPKIFSDTHYMTEKESELTKSVINGQNYSN